MHLSNYTETLRQAVTQVLGAPPDEAPLEAEILDVVEHDGYRREHVRYQVSLDDWGYAYLLLPPSNGKPLPLVYAHHRHNNNHQSGKSEFWKGLSDDPGLELVQRGYAVFAPDAIGFGERRAPESSGEEYDREYNFHLLAQRLLRGETLLRKVIWDVSRGIDYALTRPELDPNRIAFMGHGYGGRMAIWAMALEPRIRVGVAHCGIANYRDTLRRGAWFQPEFVVPRLLQVADIHHIMTLIAPRPFLLSTTTADMNQYGTNEVYRRALPAYEHFGAAHRLSFYVFEEEDPTGREPRAKALDWLNSWLKTY